MAIPPAKIKAGHCYSGEGNIDRRVVSIAEERVRFLVRPARTTEPWSNERSQSLRSFARLVHDEIDCDTGAPI